MGIKFVIDTPSNVRPNLVNPSIYGHHKSEVIKKGVRRWEFESEEGIKLFASAVQAGEFIKAEK